MLSSKELDALFEHDQAQHIAWWQKFLTFPSISAKSEHDGDCRSCLKWLAEEVEKLGFSCEMLETTGKPLLLAKREGLGKRVLFYGHYDVQPPEPLQLWISPAFEPTWREKRLYARGAQDNKGQVSYVIAALRTLISAGEFKNPITLVIEGEEEVGSHGLEGKLPEIAGKIKADLLLICDTGTPDRSIGAITVGLRGNASLEVTIQGAAKDLHSGLHGGAAPNAALLAANLIASFHDANGKVTVEGFYDEVQPVDDQTRTLVNQMPPDAKQYRGMIGVDAIGGEKGLSLGERVALRPTLEITGVQAGYTGEGFKTVIASKAIVKISLRLVPAQNPSLLVEKVKQHIARFFEPMASAGISGLVSLEEHGGEALRVPTNSSSVKLASEIIEQELQLKAMPLWFGASVPIVPALAKYSGAEPLLVGFGMEEDSIHAPNESFSLEQFKNGFLFVASLLQRLEE
jgi:acetylornithine deacetylase/succinyl-diaminopimelate desuccinylase-like protein